MIYHKPNLVVRILYESFRKKPVFGVFRPQAYMTETGNYCSNVRFDVFKNEIEQGKQVVHVVVIESPVGFGDHLREGSLLTFKEGLDVTGKAVLLEVLGYLDELK